MLRGRLRDWLSSHKGRAVYDADGMTLYRRTLPFLKDERFLAAYRRGAESGHSIAGGASIAIEYRIAVLCWAASHGTKLQGDFVECGVNTGMFSLCVCDYVNFNATGKNFWLFDTFCGIPLDGLSREERKRAEQKNAKFYPECFELAKSNFAPFPKARLVRGTVPESLATVSIDKVAYLSIDMNAAYPERAALEHFWPKLVRGAVVVLDDYAFSGHREQQQAIDEFTNAVGVSVLAVPTGQGLLVKP